MIRADYNAITRKLTHDGEEYDLSTDEGRQHIRTLVASDDDVEIVARDMSVYQTGWARKTWGIHPDHLEAYAQTMGHQDHYQGHDQTRLFGRTGLGRVEKIEGGMRLVQDLHYSTPMALHALAHGGDLRASIHPSPTAASQMVCSVCGERWLTGDCKHYVGDTDDAGNPWQLWVTDMVHRETSTTHVPASAGTGSDAAPAGDEGEEAELTVHAPMQFSRLPQFAVDYMLEMKDQQSESMSEQILAMQTQLTDLLEERDSLYTLSQRLQKEASLKAVREARERKALRVPAGMQPADFEASLAEMHMNNRAAWDLFISSVPDSQLSERVSGAEPQAPEPIQAERGTTEYYSMIAKRAREIAAETGENVKDVITRLKKEK